MSRPSRPNPALARLHSWASDQSASDPDEAARPLWAQIRDEVGAYLRGDEEPDQGGPDLFGGAS